MLIFTRNYRKKSSLCLFFSKSFLTLPGIISGYASHYTRYRQKANAFYNNETVEWGYGGIHSSELYTQRAVEIIKNHNRNVVSKL